MLGVEPGPGPDLELSLESRPWHFQSTETSAQGARLNEDRGWLRGLSLSLSPTDGRWWISAAHLEGAPSYRGRTQIGFPIATATRQVQDDWRAGGRLAGRSAGPVDLNLALEGAVRRQWRDIEPTPLSTRLTERLNWVQAGMQGELRWRFCPSEGLALRLQGQVARGWSEALRADFHRVDQPPVTVRPTAVFARSLQVGVEWSPVPAWQWRVAWSDERLHHADSPTRALWRHGQVVGAVSYPGSRQRLGGATLGWSVAW